MHPPADVLRPAPPSTDEAHWFEGVSVDYAAMNRRIDHLAATLHARGVRPGDRVVHLGHNRPDIAELVFSCARLGAMAVPLNWRLSPAEHRFVLEHCRPRLALVDPELIDALDAAVGPSDLELPRLITDPERGWRREEGRAPEDGRNTDPVLLVYTSGTTGRPKGAVLSQGALVANTDNSVAAHHLVPTDRILTFLPMFHVGGLNIQTIPALMIGASVTVQRRFEPEVALGLLADRRCTLTLGVPATVAAMVDHPQWADTDLSAVRGLMTGSSVVPDSLVRPWFERGIPVGQVYGLTETAPIATVLTFEEGEDHMGSAGLPAATSEVRVETGPDGRGEIRVRGPNVLDRYWDDPAATEAAFDADGFFRTGDIGRLDADGYLYIDDRATDVIISGGENVYPAELEIVLADCADLAEATVIGRPDERWGAVAVVFAVRRPGADIDEEAVRALFVDRLARYKHPREVLFVENLPRNVMGKVQKFELRASLGW